MIDRELASLAKSKHDQATYELYFRYKPFVNKHWYKLKTEFEKINNKSILKNLSIVKEEFDTESYEAFSKALTYLDMSEVKNDKWKFLGVYGFYLNNLRRSFRRTALKKNKEVYSSVYETDETSHDLLDTESYATPSAEDQYFKSSGDEKILYFEKNMDEFLTQKEMDFVFLKRNKNTHSDIKKIMNLSSADLKNIENSIREKIQDFMDSN